MTTNPATRASWKYLIYSLFLVSMQIVTGPSLTRATSMSDSEEDKEPCANGRLDDPLDSD